MKTKGAERLRQAAMMVALLEELSIELGDGESERTLAQMWIKLLSWLFEHRHEWSMTMTQIMEDSGQAVAQMPGRPIRFLEMWNGLKQLEGGRFLNYRILRKDEAHRYKENGQTLEIICNRYVVMDGTHDIAEVVTEAATDEIKWLFTYRSQNLVHLLQAALVNNIKVMT